MIHKLYYGISKHCNDHESLIAMSYNLYGLNNNFFTDERYVVTASDWNIRCRARCPSGGNVIWCVNVYHPVKNIEACFSEGKMVNATNAALSLNIHKYFETPVSPVQISLCMHEIVGT